MSLSLPTQPVSPTTIPKLPPPPSDPLTEDQWKTLLSIADAIIPAVKPTASANSTTDIAAKDDEYASAIKKLTSLAPGGVKDEETARRFLEESASGNPAFREALHRVFAVHMPVASAKQLGMVLSILGTRAGSLFLTGYLTPISEQPASIRESIIKSWSTARLPLLRQLFRSLTMITKQTWIKVTPTLPQILGIPRVPTGMIPGKGFDYEFLQMPPGSEPEVIETDVVIIGSGCGAGVSAKNLAEAGHRVLVVEKAYHWTPDHFPMNERNGWEHLFMSGAAMVSDDTTMTVIAGQSWGGGGTVNWSASLQTQGYVRQAWADSGLPFFTSAEYQDCLDRVCDRMGVSTEHIQHNPQNRHLLEGSRKLGYTHKAVPQNTGRKQHNCGHCTFGCGSCEKQGPVVSFLPDAARAGARFIEGFHAEKVLFESRNGEKVATGVRGTWASRDEHGGVAGEPLVKREVIIKAKRVIVSAGTMQSPLLLLRSGLTNYHIGRNLHLHPVSLVGAVYDEEIKPWEGPILTSVCSEYENLDGKGHGTKLEATNMLPSSWLIWLNWKSGLDYKLNAARMKHMAGYISVARDRDTGRVYPDPVDGRVRFEYTTSKYDQQHILTGLLALARIQYVAGAREIFTVLPGAPTFIRDDSASSDGINDAKFKAWLEEIKYIGFPSPDSMFVSAHQMSTCRMSATKGGGVVDENGLVWGTKGLYVADASAMPSASGVNPMVTNMAIADWISRGVARGLREQAKL
ncbi:long-chain fatty alcohol dehydrogenase [Aaosphaeria arxii CBS 175.79]|uniref:Long-chain-alcohol oxidase n=1 Tax=Aaosphaeria arxii CBS 175.79 TaxID=1450172 RepID=A0A6A5XD94_9PLEO|nr:long-chain fatty alcohol dehydrogenase [Aaosphaeria arxii CBS 175.79]KAF2010972.1 long-chain fatty alcohol dehydrogenase [Aaosphaeria arxii CBS 175.79]